ncbi:MAG: amidase [Rhizobiaceae bacterium]|nr:MAG: amidase [Rhizobiaceae bacterium]
MQAIDISNRAAATEIADMPASELAVQIGAKRISPVQAVEAALRRVQQRSELNAFITLCSDHARQEAKSAEAAIMRGDPVGPLCGIPFSVKDLTNTEGVRTTQGSALMADAVPASDAVAVARARAAGAILIGKTTTPEFGHKAFTEGPLFGRTLNPWSRDHTCGGSSGGAAVAVAAGMGALALGSDGGGSIRIPAACCGIAGFKATLGGIPNLQAPDLFGANSYVGPMARSVADVRLMFQAIRGADRRDPYGQKTTQWGSPRDDQPLRIGWLPKCGNILDPEVERVTLEAVMQLQDLGCEVETIELDLVSLEPHFLVLLRSMLHARLGRQRREHPDLLDTTLIATIDAGEGLTAADLWQAQFARTGCFAKVQEFLGRFDLIVSPTLSAPALPVGLDPLGEIEIAGRSAGTIRGAWYPYTFPFNLTGHPAISLPCGLTSSGLPVGLQLVGRWYEDDVVLDLAEKLEAVLAFDGTPALSANQQEV